MRGRLHLFTMICRRIGWSFYAEAETFNRAVNNESAVYAGIACVIGS